MHGVWWPQGGLWRLPQVSGRHRGFKAEGRDWTRVLTGALCSLWEGQAWRERTGWMGAIDGSEQRREGGRELRELGTDDGAGPDSDDGGQVRVEADEVTRRGQIFGRQNPQGLWWVQCGV